MGKIYAGQDFKIKLTTGNDIIGAQSVKIKYKNPIGTFGEWTANVENALTGLINYDVLSANNTLVGTYVVWAKIVDSNGLILIGESSSFVVYKEGN